MSNPPPTLRDELRSYRSLWGYSAAEMARALGVSVKSYYRFESNQCPNPRLLRLALRGLAGELAGQQGKEESYKP